MKLIQLFGLCFVFLLQFGCMTKPTKGVEVSPRRYSAPSVKGLKDLDFSEQAIIVDARPAFVHSLGYVPGSIRLQWDEFTQAEPAQKGVLQSDHSGLAKRLARAGISPQSNVTVLGRGLSGVGEEGRVAWMLAYLGVDNVEFADIASVKGKLRFAKKDPGFSPLEQVEASRDRHEKATLDQADAAASVAKPAPIWEPSIDDSLLATREEVQSAIVSAATGKPLEVQNRTTQYKILDVRSDKEYLEKASPNNTASVPNMGAINIEWKQFITPEGRPKLAMKKKLEAVGIKPEHRIIVVSYDGVSSGAVTMALRKMGYNNSANYAGGLIDLLSASSAKQEALPSTSKPAQ